MGTGTFVVSQGQSDSNTFPNMRASEIGSGIGKGKEKERESIFRRGRRRYDRGGIIERRKRRWWREKEALEKGATHEKDNGRAAMDELLDVHGARDIVGVASVMCVSFCSFCSLCGLLL